MTSQPIPPRQRPSRSSLRRAALTIRPAGRDGWARHALGHLTCGVSWIPRATRASATGSTGPTTTTSRARTSRASAARARRSRRRGGERRPRTRARARIAAHRALAGGGVRQGQRWRHGDGRRGSGMAVPPQVQPRSAGRRGRCVRPRKPKIGARKESHRRHSPRCAEDLRRTQVQVQSGSPQRSSPSATAVRTNY